jgi:hypothetical protein
MIMNCLCFLLVSLGLVASFCEMFVLQPKFFRSVSIVFESDLSFKHVDSRMTLEKHFLPKFTCKHMFSQYKSGKLFAGNRFETHINSKSGNTGKRTASAMPEQPKNGARVSPTGYSTHQNIKSVGNQQETGLFAERDTGIAQVRGSPAIECNLLATATIKGQNFAVGSPINTPVMLAYFEHNEMKYVLPSFPDYEHLLHHISNQLESSDLRLINSPVVLTLQGDLDSDEDNNDDEEDEDGGDGDGEVEEGYYEKYDGGDVTDEIESKGNEAYTLASLMASESFQRQQHRIDVKFADKVQSQRSCGIVEEEDLRDSGRDVASDKKEVSVKVGKGSASSGSLHTFSSEYDQYDQYLVTEEDTLGLERAHLLAESVVKYAEDVQLIGSFHYEKRNFHLFKLLEVGTVHTLAYGLLAFCCVYSLILHR